MDKTRIYNPNSSYSSSLDSKKHNRNTFCGRWSLHGPVHDQEPNLHESIRLQCKSWSCPLCGPKKARSVQRAIIDKATVYDLRRLLTLTLDHSTCTPEESIPHIRQCWNKFRTYLRRRYGTKITFITILELQRSGHAHLHVLVDRYIEQAWISEAWQALGGGRVVDIRHIDLHRVSAYLSKYLTKDLLLGSFKKRQRRYTTSQGLTLLERGPSHGWAVIKVPLEFAHDHFKDALIQEHYGQDGALLSFLYWNGPDPSAHGVVPAKAKTGGLN